MNLVKNKGYPPKNEKIIENFINIKNKDINNRNFNNIQNTTHLINPSQRENINNSNYNFIDKNFNKKEQIKNKKIIIKYNDFELNTFVYEQALKLDKRLYSQYYLSLIKYNQLLIFSFYTSNDYNSKIIKICLFLFLFSLYYTINTLFFNKDSIHNLYIKKGEFDFIYQIPKIMYSSLICSLIKTIIFYFSLTEKNVIEAKRTKEKEIIN